jgi:hypothetical protein
MPSLNTIARLMVVITSKVLQKCLLLECHKIKAGEVIGIEGETVRGSLEQRIINENIQSYLYY